MTTKEDMRTCRIISDPRCYRGGYRSNVMWKAFRRENERMLWQEEKMKET